MQILWKIQIGIDIKVFHQLTISDLVGDDICNVDLDRCDIDIFDIMLMWETVISIIWTNKIECVGYIQILV